MYKCKINGYKWISFSLIVKLKIIRSLANKQTFFFDFSNYSYLWVAGLEARVNRSLKNG